MRVQILTLSTAIAASLLLSGCVGPSPIRVEGSWGFFSTEQGAIWGAPCMYRSGDIAMFDDKGSELGVAEVTSTAFGLVDGLVTCNVYFTITDVPADADTFTFSVPGYDDPTEYSRDDLNSTIRIESPDPRD